MKLLEHYLILHTALKNQEKDVEFETTLQQIVDILCCSRRNAKWILNQLREQEWIEWKPGRGRGYKSYIKFQLSLLDSIKMYASEQLEQNRFKELMRFIQLLPINTQIYIVLMKYIEEWFGFQNQSEQHSLRIPINRNLTTMDPAQVASAFEYHLVGHIYETLFRIESSTGKIVPNLVLNWNTLDEKKWVFYLRKGVRFHHGRHLTSEDVLYTFQRMIDSSANALYWIGRHLKKLESSGDYTVILHFQQPMPFLLNILCSNHFSIVPYDLDITQHIVGTGPFSVSSFSKDKLILEAFDGYFKERVWVDRVEVFSLPKEVKSRYLYEMTAEFLDSITIRNEKVTQRMINTQFIIFHTKKTGPQQHHSFRKAIRLALDRNTMVNETYMNEVQPADSFLPVISKKRSFPTYTLSEAQKTLKESGYSGETMTMLISPDQWRESALWIQSRCNQIGVSVELQFLDLTETLQHSFFRQADLIMLNCVKHANSEINLIEPLSNNSLIRHLLSLKENQQIDDFIDQFIWKKTKEDRFSIWNEIEDWFRKENLILFQAHFQEIITYSNSLQGYEFETLGMAELKNIWIKNN